MQPMGHIDIYVNGGQTQPGCTNASSSVPFYKRPMAEGELVSCSHHRALEIFRDSLVSTCQAVAYECADYNSFKQVIAAFIMYYNSQPYYTFIIILCIIIPKGKLLFMWQG